MFVEVGRVLLVEQVVQWEAIMEHIVDSEANNKNYQYGGDVMKWTTAMEDMIHRMVQDYIDKLGEKEHNDTCKDVWPRGWTPGIPRSIGGYGLLK